VAAQLGYCGLDRQRRPLRGDEIRGCWEASAAPIEVPSSTPIRFAPAPTDLEVDRTPVRKLEFVEVRTTTVTSCRRGKHRVKVAVSGAGGVEQVGASGTDEAGAETLLGVSSAEPRWSLWGETES
jgi:hypothetical protein